jgi:hypothetical protein
VGSPSTVFSGAPADLNARDTSALKGTIIAEDELTKSLLKFEGLLKSLLNLFFNQLVKVGMTSRIAILIKMPQMNLGCSSSLAWLVSVADAGAGDGLCAMPGATKQVARKRAIQRERRGEGVFMEQFLERLSGELDNISQTSG